MILTDRQIQQSIQEKHLIIDPEPQYDQFSPTALDLHVGDDFRQFIPALYETPGMVTSILLDEVSIPNLSPHMEKLEPDQKGLITLPPKKFILASTLERVELPPHGRLAARVEGRSSYARLGLVIHMTAPTIHNDFRGKITLEIMNHGPFPLVVCPNKTRICQLIFERLEEEPSGDLNSAFQDQDNPLGSTS